MSCREEQVRAGYVIDSLKFAAGDECLTGTLALADLSRLSDVLAERSGFLSFSLLGIRYAEEFDGKPGLRLEVAGLLGLVCQRCLGKVDFDCRIDRLFLLVPEGEVWPEEELEAESYDAIAALQAMSVADLVEEEVLLALPIVPRHAECALPAVALPVPEGSTVSPFAALAGLKKF